MPVVHSVCQSLFLHWLPAILYFALYQWESRDSQFGQQADKVWAEQYPNNTPEKKLDGVALLVAHLSLAKILRLAIHDYQT